MFEALMSVGGLVLWLAFWWFDLRHGTPTQQEAEMWHKAAPGVAGIDGPRRGPAADGSQKPNDAAAIPRAKAGNNTDTPGVATDGGKHD